MSSNVVQLAPIQEREALECELARLADVIQDAASREGRSFLDLVHETSTQIIAVVGRIRLLDN